MHKRCICFQQKHTSATNAYIRDIHTPKRRRKILWMRRRNNMLSEAINKLFPFIFCIWCTILAPYWKQAFQQLSPFKRMLRDVHIYAFYSLLIVLRHIAACEHIQWNQFICYLIFVVKPLMSEKILLYWLKPDCYKQALLYTLNSITINFMLILPINFHVFVQFTLENHTFDSHWRTFWYTVKNSHSHLQWQRSWGL